MERKAAVHKPVDYPCQNLKWGKRTLRSVKCVVSYFLQMKWCFIKIYTQESNHTFAFSVNYSLTQKQDWKYTWSATMARKSSNVKRVARNVFPKNCSSVTWAATVKTVHLNATSAVVNSKDHMKLRNIKRFIRVRRTMCVMFVAMQQCIKHAWRHIRKDTLVIICSSATFVVRDFFQVLSSENTRTYTQVKNLTCVTSVGRPTHLRTASWHIRKLMSLMLSPQKRFMSVRYAARDLSTVNPSWYMWNLTLVKNSCVTSVGRHSLPKTLWNFIGEITRERNQMCVMCVVRHSVHYTLSKCTNSYTLGKNPIYVTSVGRPSHSVPL